MKILMLILFGVILLIATPVAAGTVNQADARPEISDTQLYVDGIRQNPSPRHYDTTTPRHHDTTSLRRDYFLGERFVAGDTWYDFQTNGSLGKMIAIAPNGGVHITWTDGIDDDLENGERHQKYNYYTPDGEWIEEDGYAVDTGNILRAGFGCLWLTTDDEPRALSFYHGKIDNVWRGMSGVDLEPGFGAFDSTPLPVYPEQTVYFPQGVMTPEGRIHVVYQRRDRAMISYAQGEIDEDGFLVFGDFPIQVGETHRTNFRIACSQRSERTVIGYTTARAGIPAPDNWGVTTAYAMNNDLLLVWTDDGEDWNFDEPLNVTCCIPPDPHLEGDAAYGDTLRPNANFDIILDAEDNIHVVFDARGFWEQPIPEDEPPVDGITIDASLLFHWSEQTDDITPVADGWFIHREVDDDGETTRWPTPGGWKSNVCAPSLAYGENGDLYCVFNYYPLKDYSLEDYCNGDIAVTVSEDNGDSWYLPTMITETGSHMADEGESESELYPTLALTVDDYLHISYELDTEPGSPISDHQSRNEWPSLCPWIYHRVPVDDVLREEIWEDGPTWHADYRSVSNNEHNPVPKQLVIEPAYPNPFNAVTRVGFTLNSAGYVHLTIYDTEGRFVMDVLNRKMDAGYHYTVIDATDFSTGIYILHAEASAPQASASQKLVLVK